MIAFTVCEITTDLKTLETNAKHSLLMYTYKLQITQNKLKYSAFDSTGKWLSSLFSS